MKENKTRTSQHLFTKQEALRTDSYRLSNVAIEKGEAISLYEMMLRIRHFEIAVEKALKNGEFHGTTHLYNGQEAVAVGVCSELRAGDMITSTHRGHGHSIAMGASVKKMMAEIYGKATGYSKGKGGSMHIADVAAGNLGSNGIVGGGIPIAVGAALSAQMQRKKYVTVCFFGDGATNEGSFHEALNLASIWNVPVVFVCENNKYGMSSRIDEMTNITELSKRAEAYGISGVTIDGNDVLQVKQTARQAIERARNGGGPTLIEAKTYRYKGHSRSDKQRYRSEKEVATYKNRDPIDLFERSLLEANVLDETMIVTMKQTVEREINDAVTFARESEDPAESELFRDVYA